MEKTLFDNIEFVERLESLMEGYEIGRAHV